MLSVACTDLFTGKNNAYMPKVSLETAELATMIVWVLAFYYHFKFLTAWGCHLLSTHQKELVKNLGYAGTKTCSRVKIQ